MEPEEKSNYLNLAERHLAAVRSSLLIVAQGGDHSAELAAAARALRLLKEETSKTSFDGIKLRIGECEAALDRLFVSGQISGPNAYAVLDLVAHIEASVLDLRLADEELIPDIAGFLDKSFADIDPHKNTEPEKPKRSWLEQVFDIDDETLEIFRSEAADLLVNIENDLRQLQNDPQDQSALWDIRRNAHTFKGAAGIVGIRNASELAHKLEDLLDRVVEKGEGTPLFLLPLIGDTATALRLIVDSDISLDTSTIEARLEHAAGMSPSDEKVDPLPETQTQASSGSLKTAQKSVVRVELDRLDELLGIAREYNSTLERLSAELGSYAKDKNVIGHLSRGRSLGDEIVSQLIKIRLVRFGNLETRLARTVNVTCQEENKLASLVIENGDVELDTQLVDALVEPLLHLLRNSVVHGIEPPDTRRLIGKPERGLIIISLRENTDGITIMIADDGRGISADIIRQRAIERQLISPEKAGRMDDSEAIELIFDQGLTTADKIDLNAGRGIGMSIVKESIEAKNGNILVESEPQHGTVFTINFPLPKHEGRASSSVTPQVEIPREQTTKKDKRPLVLVVDDSASIRRRTTQMIEEHGCRTISATDGVEALEMLFSGDWQPDVVFSDIEMPKMDGWELLETIKAHDLLKGLPVVVVTSLSTQMHKERAARLGASAYIVKPISDRAIKGCLESVGLITGIPA